MGANSRLSSVSARSLWSFLMLGSVAGAIAAVGTSIRDGDGAAAISATWIAVRSASWLAMFLRLYYGDNSLFQEEDKLKSRIVRPLLARDRLSAVLLIAQAIAMCLAAVAIPLKATLTFPTLLGLVVGLNVLWLVIRIERNARIKQKLASKANHKQYKKELELAAVLDQHQLRWLKVNMVFLVAVGLLALLPESGHSSYTVAGYHVAFLGSSAADYLLTQPIYYRRNLLRDGRARDD
jgi:hypothetical protein